MAIDAPASTGRPVVRLFLKLEEQNYFLYQFVNDDSEGHLVQFSILLSKVVAARGGERLLFKRRNVCPVIQRKMDAKLKLISLQTIMIIGLDFTQESIGQECSSEWQTRPVCATINQVKNSGMEVFDK